MLKIAPEGYPFISIAAAVTAVAFILGGAWAAALPLMLTIFIVYFFRDPERNTPRGDNLYISPSDGRVIQNQAVTEKEYLKCRAVEISILMSPLNVYGNRAPCSGVVGSVVHT